MYWELPARMKQIYDRSPYARCLAIVFVISLGVRVVFWCGAWYIQLTPRFDEFYYFRIASAYAEGMSHLIRGEPVPSSVLNQAYHNGDWPPVHPMFTGFFLFLFGATPTVARLASVLASSLSSPILFALTDRMAGRKAALLATGIHISYPTFVAFSHFIWSESLFGLSLLLAVFCALLAVEGAHRSTRRWLSVLSGSLLGLAGLTRAAVLPFVGMLAVWIFCNCQGMRERVITTFSLLGALIVVVLPWEVLLYACQGEFITLSRKTDMAFVLAAHDFQCVRPGERSRLYHKTFKELEAYAQNNNLTRGDAARQIYRQHLARQSLSEIVHDMTAKFAALWQPDFFLLRHIFRVAYPPLPPVVVKGIILLVVVSYAMLVSFAAVGLMFGEVSWKYRALTLLLVVGGMLPYLMTIAITRYHFPLLLLLVPSAGSGGLVAWQSISNWFHQVRTAQGWVPAWRPAIAIGLPLLAAAGFLATSDYRGYVKSIHYRDLIENDGCSFRDAVVFRAEEAAAGKHVEITVRDPAYTILRKDEPFKILSWSTQNEPVLKIRLVARDPQGPPVVTLRIPDQNRSVTIHPVDSDHWKRWRTTGLEGIDFQWKGGG